MQDEEVWLHKAEGIRFKREEKKGHAYALKIHKMGE